MSAEFFCPRIALTAGEPAGIGPDIVIQAAQQSFAAELVAIADPDVLIQRSRLLKLPLELIHYQQLTGTDKHVPGTLKILPVKTGEDCQPGKPDPETAHYVLETLKIATDGCLRHEFSAMVTAPVHKAIINESGRIFTGHTEYLAGICKASQPVMLLTDKTLRVALVTTHLALSEVSRSITAKRLIDVIDVINHDLRARFGMADPRLLVCGLNPHAGEGGYLGREEIEIIIPALDLLRRHGVHITGPVPADTAFTPESLAQADVVIAMYHDQGLPVLKARGFGCIVNITLGLPVIRTSVDHGTALPLAGTGRANCSSLIAAIECALGMVHCERGLSSLPDAAHRLPLITA